MAELWFVGLGLDDERGLSARALDVLRRSEVFFEQYTAIAPEGTVDRLAGLLGRPVTTLDRSAVESERPILDALARTASVALLTVGDPFSATTHVALRLAAERAGHRWRYLPNASILTAAAGFLGLMHYRFGRPVSLPLPDGGFAPTSPVERIAENRRAELHTLLLLDLRPESGRYLTAGAALALLRERDPDGVAVGEDQELAVAARVGRDDAAGFAGTVRQLREVDFGPPMHCVVVLAPTLHFEEEAALSAFRLGPRP